MGYAKIFQALFTTATRGIEQQYITDYAVSYDNAFDNSDTNDLYSIAKDIKKDGYLSENERKILVDILNYDVVYDQDPEYNAEYATKNTNLAIQLQHISDKDIKSYIQDSTNGLGLQNSGDEVGDDDFAVLVIQDLFLEARQLSKTHVGSSGIASLKSINHLFRQLGNVDENISNSAKYAIQAAVSNFDKADNPSDTALVKQDLNDFSTFYALTIDQKNKLNALYSMSNQEPYYAVPLSFL